VHVPAPVTKPLLTVPSRVVKSPVVVGEPPVLVPPALARISKRSANGPPVVVRVQKRSSEPVPNCITGVINQLLIVFVPVVLLKFAPM
jgi:hypothetical protein